MGMTGGPDGRGANGAGEGGGPEEEIEVYYEETGPIVAGVGKPDEEVRRWLEEEERKRKAKEEAEGKGVTVVTYTPGAGIPRLSGSRRLLVLVVVLLLVLVPILYFVAIPRASAELVIQYHEGIAGGIFVDARLENRGTRAMTDVKVSILVQNSSDVRMADPIIFEGRVSPYNDASMDSVSFTADQWETYHIFVEWSFDCAGRSYTGSEHYDTGGEAMNVWFEQDLTP